MWERDKLFSRYFKAKNTDTKHSLFNECRSLRNELTAKKRNGKIQYYRDYFENKNKKISAIWKSLLLRSSLLTKLISLL